jgi:hypothetical protein
MDEQQRTDGDDLHLVEGTRSVDTRWVQTKAYTTHQAAAAIGVDDSTMRRWRTATPPEGPAFVQVSPRKYRYYEADIVAYLQSKRNDPSGAAQ